MRTHTLLPATTAMMLMTACGAGAGDSADTSGDSDVASVTPTWSTTIVGTDQTDCYDASGGIIDCPAAGEEFSGQDGADTRNAPSYTDNGDGTVTDLNTGLRWQWEQADKVAYDDAADTCADLSLGGTDAWRVPSTKELYSLILFSGATGSGSDADMGAVPDDAVPYIDDSVFDFAYGDTAAGERYIDTQFISTNIYVSNAFADNDGQSVGEECFFGVNYADGRIKCYPTSPQSTWQLRCVTDGDGYGDNDLIDNGDGSVSDNATGLMWTQQDSGGLGGGPDGDGTMDWVQALAWCQAIDEAGYDDWRLPHAKELQSLVDYSRSPDTTDSAAIDPVFDATPIVAEDGSDNYAWYWTSTTHLDGMTPGTDAVYVAFGEALGYTATFGSDEEMMLDVHGAGAQRGDPKVGDPGDYPQSGMGPQGDVRRVFNMARCVRDQG